MKKIIKRSCAILILASILILTFSSVFSLADNHSFTYWLVEVSTFIGIMMGIIALVFLLTHVIKSVIDKLW